MQLFKLAGKANLDLLLHSFKTKAILPGFMASSVVVAEDAAGNAVVGDLLTKLLKST